MKLLGVSFIGIAALLAVASTAIARERDVRRAKRLAAYALDSEVPIHAAVCPRGRRADGRCATTFKTTAARRLCQRYGRGRHDWYYVVGPASERRTAVALCL